MSARKSLDGFLRGQHIGEHGVAPTLLLNAPSNNAGHAINGQVRLGYLTLEHLVREGAAWGMDEDEARDTAVSALEAAAAAASETQPDTHRIPRNGWASSGR